MLQQKTLSQWIAVAAVLPVTLFTFGHVHGQATGSEAVFQGRPAIGGAQGGTGAMAGPAQGGVAPQSVDQSGGGIVLRRPGGATGTDTMVPRDPGVTPPEKGAVDLKPQRDRDSGEVIKRERDSSATGDKTSSKVKRAARRSYDRVRHGVSGVDS
ncbi:MAG: hypothetical protein ACXWJJ_09555 [Ramlibacter sp.]